MNKIISIGFTGLKHCYLNVSREEAIARYLKSEEMELTDIDPKRIDEFEFEDEFGAYDIWSPDEM